MAGSAGCPEVLQEMGGGDDLTLPVPAQGPVRDLKGLWRSEEIFRSLIMGLRVLGAAPCMPIPPEHQTLCTEVTDLQLMDQILPQELAVTSPKVVTSRGTADSPGGLLSLQLLACNQTFKQAGVPQGPESAIKECKRHYAHKTNCMVLLLYVYKIWGIRVGMVLKEIRIVLKCFVTT